MRVEIRTNLFSQELLCCMFVVKDLEVKVKDLYFYSSDRRRRVHNY